MEDMNDRVKERWEQRRKRANNWPRLLIMLIILIAIIVGINMLNKAADRMRPSQVEYRDSTAVDSTQAVPAPAADTNQ